MLSEIKKLCKQLLNLIKTNEKDLFLAIVVVLVAVISFGLGRLSKIRDEKTPITIESPMDNFRQPATSTISTIIGDKIFVASRNGKKYYYAWCDAANSIKEQNRVWFATAEEARKSGFEPAANCRGLK